MEYMNLSSHKKMKKEKKILESYGMMIYMIIFFMLNGRLEAIQNYGL